MSTVRHTAFNDDGDTAESRLGVTQFLVEATSNEWQMLWERHCKESSSPLVPLIDKWESLGGWLVQVDQLFGRPICISLNWCRLDGFLVCQWEPTSQLVDHELIDKWLEAHFTLRTRDDRSATCNSSNFHHCLHEIADWKKEQNPETVRTTQMHGKIVTVSSLDTVRIEVLGGGAHSIPAKVIIEAFEDRGETTPALDSVIAFQGTVDALFYAQLEMRRMHDEWTVWHPASAGMYDAARKLTYQRRFVEALQTAEETHVANYGDMRNVEFRIVEESKTAFTL